MSKINIEKRAVEEIGEWIRARLMKAGAKTAVVGLSGGVDSALVALICQDQDIPVVTVALPCHSNPASYERARELAEVHGLPFFKVNLEAAFESITEQADPELVTRALPEDADSSAADASLRSCLRPAVLDYIAKRVNGLILGTGNRDEDEVVRYYNKRGDGAVDLNPIRKLHKSEVYRLARHLGCTDAILKAKPSADLLGPDTEQTDEGDLGITYEEIEWALKLNDRSSGVFFTDEDSDWGRLHVSEAMQLTERQREVLLKLRQMERASRHKENPIPAGPDLHWLFGGCQRSDLSSARTNRLEEQLRHEIQLRNRLNGG